MIHAIVKDACFVSKGRQALKAIPFCLYGDLYCQLPHQTGNQPFEDITILTAALRWFMCLLAFKFNWSKPFGMSSHLVRMITEHAIDHHSLHS